MPLPEDQSPTAAGARQTLAERIAERNRQRAIRAERLARLRPGAAGARAGAAGTQSPAVDPPITEAAPDAAEADAALEDFLRALTEGLLLEEKPAPPSAAGEIVRLPRPVLVTERCDLEALPGIGPGLIWALRRAGIHTLADLAGLAAEDLPARHGPAGRLVPATACIATARAAAPAPQPG
jgi:predicted flap endonuclease-1-like 5' DNA nuclease